MSACLISVTPSLASSGYTATPIEQVSVGIWSDSRNGAWNDSRMRVITVITSNVAVRGIEARQDHDELVAAEARDGVGSRARRR